MEPLSLTAGAIASLAFTKFFETSVEKFTENAIAKMDVLRKKIWDRLRGNVKAETALTAAENGSKSDLDKVAEYLLTEMRNEAFAKEVQALAHEINQEINIGELQGQNVQNVYGGQAEQNNAINTNAPVIQGGTGHNITFN